MKSKMQGLILAAGCGSRLNSSDQGNPKCLVPIGGLALIEYQLILLQKAGIERVAVVVGCGAEQVRQLLGDRVEYIENGHFSKTNSLYSLWLARHWVRGSFVLMNSDILVHPEIVEQVVRSGGNVLAYDSSSGQEEEHMKVSFEGGYLARISKALAQVQTQGENVGILKFDGEGTQALFSKADELVRTAGGENLWAPSALDEIVKDMPVRGVDVAGIPWTEIDFAEDLAYARQEIWPAILNDFEVRIPVSETHPRASIPVE